MPEESRQLSSGFKLLACAGAFAGASVVLGVMYAYTDTLLIWPAAVVYGVTSGLVCALLRGGIKRTPGNFFVGLISLVMLLLLTSLLFTAFAGERIDLRCGDWLFVLWILYFLVAVTVMVGINLFLCPSRPPRSSDEAGPGDDATRQEEGP